MSNTTQNNTTDNNNNNNNNTKSNGTQACAACKYQRRKCASDCLLAPYFPHHLHHQFLNAHKLFGVSNITKIIRPLPQPQKDQAMRTIKFESDVRASDPVGGSCRIILDLQRQIEFAYAELDLVQQQLAICRAVAAADPVSLMCDPDPQPQPQNVGIESEDATIHCDAMINNNVEDHASNEYKAEPISPFRQQTQSQLQAENDDDVTIQCDSMINNNPEDQFYLHDFRHLEENNEEGDAGIGDYFLERDDVNIGNPNEILALQDMEEPWAMQGALTYCLHDKEGFVNECKDSKPMDMGGKRLGLKYQNHEVQIFEHSDEAISKDDKVIVQEETASCISKDEKPILREDSDTIEDAQSHELRSAATKAYTY